MEQSKAAENTAEKIKERVIGALKSCYDPEIPVDIYELGLIYNVEVSDDGQTALTMTLTSPMCPVAETLPLEVEQRVGGVDGVSGVKLDLVWEPPWDPTMMSEAARLELGF